MTECIRLSGREALPYLDDLASLRCSVFKDYPYLYEGTEEYERIYLGSFFSAKGSVLVIVIDGDKVVGASTGMPLIEADQVFIKPFLDAGRDVSSVFYFGESVLLPEWRGRGFGHRFFDERENWASVNGFSVTAFCSVVRDPNDPRKPESYRPHDPFWKKRGYKRDNNLVAMLPWKVTGSSTDGEAMHDLVFWLKE